MKKWKIFPHTWEGKNKWVLLATSFHNHVLLDRTKQNWIIYSGRRENKTNPTDYFRGTEVKKLNFLFASFILSPIHSFLPIHTHISTVIPAGRRQYMPQAVRSSTDADWPLVHTGQFAGQLLSNDVQQLNAAHSCFILSRDINLCHPSISERAMLFQTSSSLFKCG